MEIKRTSWHYRFMDACGVKPMQASTLCQYLRKLCWATMLSVAYIVFALLSVAILLRTAYALGLAVAQWLDWKPPWLTEDEFVSWWLAGRFLWVAVALGGLLSFLAYGLPWVLRTLRAGRSRPDPCKATKPPGVIATAWKDFVEKTCTIITFK